MIRKHRRWETICEDDPGAGLLNLFDVWVAFSVALLLALVAYLNSMSEIAKSPDDAQPKRMTIDEIADKEKMPRYRPTEGKLDGEGSRLGVAYRLKSGEVVYVPDNVALTN